MLKSQPLTIPFVRRLSLLHLLGISFEQAAAGFKLLEREPNNKLLLSYGLKVATEKQSEKGRLAYLTRLGERLMREFPRSDQLKTFELVLPELLGDSWAAENPERAIACYKRIVQRRGDHPRILQKLITILERTGKSDEEANYLVRLSHIEKRKSALTKIFYRLALLYKAQGKPKEAFLAAQRSLKTGRDSPEAIVLLVDLLIDENNFQEALALLAQSLKEGEQIYDDRYKAHLEMLSGNIWQNRLGRGDLAKYHFKKALHFDPALKEADQALKQLEGKEQEFVFTANQWDEGFVNSQFNVNESSVFSKMTHDVQKISNPSIQNILPANTTKVRPSSKSILSSFALQPLEVLPVISEPNAFGEDLESDIQAPLNLLEKDPSFTTHSSQKKIS